MELVWKAVPGYEGIYEVSNYGDVKSLKYDKEKMLKKVLSHSYLIVSLWIKGKKKNHRVNRLVWEAFNGPIPEKMQVNHKNEIKVDNRLCNLELLTPSENVNYGTRNKKAALTLLNNKYSKQVLQYDLDGNFIKEWSSIKEIYRELNISTSLISACCNEKAKSSHGFVWKFKKAS